MAEVGLAEGIQALKSSKIARDGKLLYHGVPLTSEKLRSIIDVGILQAGGLPGIHRRRGRQACDPHEPGHGPLRGHQPIILMNPAIGENRLFRGHYPAIRTGQ